MIPKKIYIPVDSRKQLREKGWIKKYEFISVEALKKWIYEKNQDYNTDIKKLSVLLELLKFLEDEK